MLYLVATPIGHLDDFSHRALKTLNDCELILCEDTRHSSILFKRYGIQKPLLAFHKFNEKQREENILAKLEQGAVIGLISDAGTPLISDPGYDLVQECIARNLPFTAIPGSCSVIQALLLSGFSTLPFQFIGFLPREKKPLTQKLRKALCYEGTTVAFESPQRLIATLKILTEFQTERKIAVARELTKTFEECIRGSAEELYSHFQEKKPRGELVLLIEKGLPLAFDQMPLEECIVQLREDLGLSMKEAIKTASQLLNVSKRDAYRAAHLLD